LPQQRGKIRSTGMPHFASVMAFCGALPKLAA